MEMNANPGPESGYRGTEEGIPEGSVSGGESRWKSNVGSPERWASAAVGGALAYLAYRSLKDRDAKKRKNTWLGSLLAIGGANLLLRGALGKSMLYKALGISTAAKAAGKIAGPERVEKSTVVDRPAEEIYRFWRNVENLPRIMDHLKAVRSIDDRRSHWVAKGPVGMEVEWDAEITEELDGRRIAWRSLEGSTVKTSGEVSFDPAPDGRGTEIRVILEYRAPGGKAGAAAAKILGADPDKQVAQDLEKFKRLLETGEPAQGQFARG